jgi:hypothetical protein
MSTRYAGLCVITRVADGREDALRAHLQSLPKGHSSPLARVEGTHFARWEIVRLRDKHGEEIASLPAHLLFSSECDGTPKRYARALCEGLGDEAHAIWGNCVGYPGRDRAALADYLMQHRVDPGYSVVAYPGASVEHVRACLALRDRVNEFVIRARDLEPHVLLEAWVQSFRQRELER